MTADYWIAYGSETYADDDVIGDTELRTMSGAGHQHFINSARNSSHYYCDHIRSALFATWIYSDPRPSMRWDPQDDRRYAPGPPIRQAVSHPSRPPQCECSRNRSSSLLPDLTVQRQSEDERILPQRIKGHLFLLAYLGYTDHY